MKKAPPGNGKKKRKKLMLFIMGYNTIQPTEQLDLLTAAF